LTALAKTYGITARSIVIVYSTKSLLTSDTDLKSWRGALDSGIAQPWDKRISDEILFIEQQFRLEKNGVKSSKNGKNQ
jgi:hypothetical protein